MVAEFYQMPEDQPLEDAKRAAKRVADKTLQARRFWLKFGDSRRDKLMSLLKERDVALDEYERLVNQLEDE